MERDWQFGYTSQYEEFEYTLNPSFGTIPASLNGVLYRIGPGIINKDGHPLDGDGMITSYSFENRRVRVKNVFIRTYHYRQRIKNDYNYTWRGVFDIGTAKTPFWPRPFRFKNPSNTNLVYWNHRLFSLWEAGLPYEIDPVTLQTIGESRFFDTLPAHGVMNAHPKQDTTTDRLVTMSAKPRFRTRIVFREYNRDGCIDYSRSLTVPHFTLIHDFDHSRNFYIFFKNTYQFNKTGFLMGRLTPNQAIKLNPDSLTLILTPRNTEKMISIPIPLNGFVTHIIQCFEDNHKITVDAVVYPTAPDFSLNEQFSAPNLSSIPPSFVLRIEVDVNKKIITTCQRHSLNVEFPAFQKQLGVESPSFVCVGDKSVHTRTAPPSVLYQIDGSSLTITAEFKFLRHQVPGEPVAMIDSHGYTWISSLVYNSKKDISELFIFDSHNIIHGPCCVLPLYHHIPYGLHGIWVPRSIM